MLTLNIVQPNQGPQDRLIVAHIAMNHAMAAVTERDQVVVVVSSALGSQHDMVKMQTAAHPTAPATTPVPETDPPPRRRRDIAPPGPRFAQTLIDRGPQAVLAANRTEA